ncbi:MAG: aspartate-ammonia lyase [Myxococcales bacterium]|nr:aspartate-ammonia lyase [Myxococcales bacterium]
MSSLITLNLIGTAGEYFVCAELCRLGYLALLTPKNNPLFDVVATTADGNTSVSIQVKTRSIRNKQGWKLGAHFSVGRSPENLFVVLVNLKDSGLPDFHVYDYATLVERVESVYRSYIDKPRRDGQPRKEVGFRWFDEVSFTEADRGRINNWRPILAALGAA